MSIQENLTLFLFVSDIHCLHGQTIKKVKTKTKIKASGGPNM